MASRITSAGLAALVFLALACPTLLWAQGDGELHSNSYWVRMFTLNNGGRHQLQGAHYKANACVGDFGHSVLSSSHFQLISGFCPQSGWFLSGGTLIAVLYPDLIIDNALAPPAPNPTSQAVRLGFAIREGEVGAVRVYDIAGRLVRTLVPSVAGPASESILWDLEDGHGRSVAAGIYFARLETQSTKLTRQIVLVGH